jgi:hypothetical protein
MVTLFLGVLNVILCCVLRFSCGIQIRACNRKPKGGNAYGLTYRIYIFLYYISKPNIDSNLAYSYTKTTKTYVLRFGLPDIHEGTIQQLKNAGGLRLVRNKEVLNEINNHYLNVTRMKSVYDIEVLIRSKLVESMGEVLDAKLLINLNMPSDSFKLATTEKSKINSYMNSLLAAKQINQRVINWLDSSRVSTIKLNQLITEEYHLN